MLKRSLTLLTTTLLLLAVPITASASPLESKNRIRAGINDSGFGIDWEHKLNQRFGLGLSVFTTRLNEWDDWNNWEDWNDDWHYGYGEDDRARLTPITVSALFHMTPNRAVDLYLGPGVAFLFYSDEGDSRTISDDTAAMFQIGFDAGPRDSKWGFNLDLKHIFDTNNGNGPYLDTATLRAGVTVRF